MAPTHAGQTFFSTKNKKASGYSPKARILIRQRPTLPPTWGSTIGAVRLNFSVRNGKRWFPHAIITGNSFRSLPILFLFFL